MRLPPKAYRDTLSQAEAWQGLHELINDLDVSDVTELASRAAQARNP